MLRGILGVTLTTTIVAVIAAVSVIGMILLIDSTRLLTQTASNTDGSYYADLAESCDAFLPANCDYDLN